MTLSKYLKEASWLIVLRVKETCSAVLEHSFYTRVVHLDFILFDKKWIFGDGSDWHVFLLPLHIWLRLIGPVEALDRL